MLEEFDDILDVNAACEALKCGKNTLYGLLESGKLKAYRIGRRWRVPRQAIVEFIFQQAKL